ncbi:MAG: 2-dehydropantoate 2-reductase [Deltaproteobacteria bacterium]|nr:2-dehydropantoate 2-reductase [Deltaproteobacteria bacterium]
MNIIILGAGAIGLVFGGFLSQSGNRVVLLGRRRILAPLKDNGLVIEGIWGTHHIRSLRGYESLREIGEQEPGRFDLALLTVKAYDSERVLKEYMDTFGVPLVTVSLQNGLGNLEKVVTIMGKERALAGRVIFGAEIASSGRVRVTVSADSVVVGGVKGGMEHGMVRKVASLFTEAGVATVASEEIEKYIWGKVLYNSALNGLGAILGVKYGLLLDNRWTRGMISDLVREAFSVMGREGVSVEWDSPERYIDELFERLIPATYDHYPSMLRDLQNGKRTEIDAINGAIVALGEKHGLDVPVNWLVTNLVKVKEKISAQRGGNGY